MNTGQWPPVPLSGTITTSKTVSCVNQINDGGPAFATTATATSIARKDDGSSILTNYGSSAGMSLRDYFAAAALQGLIANGGCPTWDDDAKAAYAAADAMLQAREAK